MNYLLFKVLELTQLFKFLKLFLDNKYWLCGLYIL